MYRIVRFYRDDKMLRRNATPLTDHDYYNGMTIKEGLTLEEAQEHCDDPETSSRTCTDESHEQQHGPWFDGYREQ